MLGSRCVFDLIWNINISLFDESMQGEIVFTKRCYSQHIFVEQQMFLIMLIDVQHCVKRYLRN